MKVYLIYTGNDGDSGVLYKICKNRSKCFQVIGELNKDFSFENPGADISRNLLTAQSKITKHFRRMDNIDGVNIAMIKSIWVRIDEVEVVE